MSADTANDQLRSFVERIERLEEEIKSINDDKRDVYAEAKGSGFDVKVLKKIVADRRKDANERAEQDAIYQLYWDAIHGTGTEDAIARASAREAA